MNDPTPTFIDPSDFLDHIKLVEAQHLPKIVLDEEFQRIHQEQMKQYGAALPEGADNYDQIIRSTASEIELALPLPLRGKYQTSVAVGCLEHESVNAMILSDSNGNCAIVVCKGFMLLLNKFLKLVGAAREPTAVIYCSRGDPSTFSSKDYREMIDQVLIHYASEGKPLGPRLKLNPESDAAAFVAGGLVGVERFVVLHEIGHFANGDLEKTSAFRPWHLDDGIGVFTGNSSHDCEFAADKFAFEYLLRMACAEDKDALAMPVLATATMTFNFLRGISDQDSYSHPASSDRLVKITDTFFGASAANTMQESFATPQKLSDVVKIIGDERAQAVIDRVSGA